MNKRLLTLLALPVTGALAQTTIEITENNEGDLTGPTPQVAPPREETLTLSSGAKLQIPPHTLTAMEWEVE